MARYKINGEVYVTISEASEMLGMDRNELYTATLEGSKYYGLERMLLHGAIIVFRLSSVANAVNLKGKRGKWGK